MTRTPTITNNNIGGTITTSSRSKTEINSGSDYLIENSIVERSKDVSKKIGNIINWKTIKWISIKKKNKCTILKQMIWNNHNDKNQTRSNR